MNNRVSYRSIGRRVGSMLGAWLLVGAVVGAMGEVGLLAGDVSGMIICSILGIVFGLIGGDAIGTLVVAGLLGLAAVAGAPIDVRFGMMFGGLLGGTIRPWIRMSYRLLLGVWSVSHFLARRFSAVTLPARSSLEPHWNLRLRTRTLAGRSLDRMHV